MKKYSFALLSILFISTLMAFSPVTQADEEQERNERYRELNQREQELNQREEQLNYQLQEQKLNRQLEQQKQALDQRQERLYEREKKLDKSYKSYADKVGEKALSGFTEMNSAFLEIPKNIINTTNESNVVYGFIGGLTKGLLHTMGRVTAGFADVITAPIITTPISQPGHVWEDFDIDTTYGKALRLDNDPTRFEPLNKCDIYLDPPCH